MAASSSRGDGLLAAPALERILCCNVLTADEHSQPTVYRHPMFSYDEQIPWPPHHWEAVVCRYCSFPWPEDRSADWVPATMPMCHDKKRDVWHVFGLYCSWNCAKAEIIRTHGFGCGEQVLLLEHLARNRFGHCGMEIVPAPAKDRLARFSGPEGMSIEEFRRDSVSAYTTVMRPPMLSLPEVYERHSLSRLSPTGWSVKGIRAKGTPEEEEEKVWPFSEGVEPPRASQYVQFMKTRKAADAARTGAAVQSERAKAEPNEGTLLNWVR